MFLNNIKHNLIIIFCILLMINGCNRENSKLIIENKSTPEKTKITDVKESCIGYGVLIYEGRIDEDKVLFTAEDVY